MSLENEGIVLSMPVLALRGLVIFPKTLASFDVGRKKSANALKYAMEKNQLIYVVTQKGYVGNIKASITINNSKITLEKAIKLGGTTIKSYTSLD